MPWQHAVSTSWMLKNTPVVSEGKEIKPLSLVCTRFIPFALAVPKLNLSSLIRTPFGLNGLEFTPVKRQLWLTGFTARKMHFMAAYTYLEELHYVIHLILFLVFVILQDVYGIIAKKLHLKHWSSAFTGYSGNISSWFLFQLWASSTLLHLGDCESEDVINFIHFCDVTE